MDKKKAHYDLGCIKSLIVQGRVAFSSATLAGAGALSMDEAAITEVIANLEHSDFYLSKMASSQTKIWLDLYRPITSRGQIFLKLKAVDDLFIVSFVPMTASRSSGA